MNPNNPVRSLIASAENYIRQLEEFITALSTQPSPRFHINTLRALSRDYDKNRLEAIELVNQSAGYHGYPISETTPFTERFDVSDTFWRGNIDDISDAESDIKERLNIAITNAKRLADVFDGIYERDLNKGENNAPNVTISESYPKAGDNVIAYGVGIRANHNTWKLLLHLQRERAKGNRVILSELETISDYPHKLLKRFNDKHGAAMPIVDFPHGVKGRGYSLC